jgi:hypothetical protein
MSLSRHAGGRLGEWTGCAFFTFVALFAAATPLCTIVNFGFLQPMFDQWREYEFLLEWPFPQNVIQLDNGHRPIVPNLVRLAEINWFGANQILQLSVGTLCAYLTAAILALAAWRDRDRSRIVRCAGMMLMVLGIVWLGNARRLLHGSESLHGYLPTLATAVACGCVCIARRRQALSWIAASCSACMIATFSFGVGLASFPAVVLLMLLYRLPLRWLWFPSAMFVACAVLYLFVLPGDQGVRGQLSLDPVDGLRATAQWISAPWVNGWLGFGDRVSDSADWQSRPWYIHVMGASSLALIKATGLSVHGLALILGFVGIVLFCVYLLGALLHRRQVGEAETLAAGMATYALVSAVITTLSRSSSFKIMPEQVFADRYMLWPCLFWACLALLALYRHAAARSRSLKIAGLTVLVALPCALYPTQEGNAIWGALVYRVAQQSAAQLRSGIYDAPHFPGERKDARVELSEIDLLRKRHLAMFADPAWQRVGTKWSGTLDRSDDYAVDVRWQHSLTDAASGKPAGHLEGWITHGISRAQAGAQLAVIDAHGTIAGLAEYSFISPLLADSLMLHLPHKRGFDAYVREFVPGSTYTLALLDLKHDRGVELATLPEAGGAAERAANGTSD